MLVKTLDSYNKTVDDFVRHTPEGKICHLTEWGMMIAKTFGHRPLYLAAFKEDDVVGVLPLTLIKSKLFGNRIVSQAFSNYGGAIAADPDTQKCLVNRAVELTMEHSCAHLELRSLLPIGRHLSERTDKVCMHLPLASNPDDRWAQFRPEIRNRVRKANKAGLRTLLGGRDLLPDFYRVWTRRMRQLGTPAYPRRLFENILETFPKETTIGVAKLGHKTVGGGFFYCFNGLAQCRWAAVDISVNKLAPNILLYWSAIKHYCQEGASVFDFGRSTFGSPQYEFKRRWGPEVIHLHYAYWTPNGTPVAMVRPDDPRYSRKVRMWKKMPLWTTRLMGPMISRSLA